MYPKERSLRARSIVDFQSNCHETTAGLHFQAIRNISSELNSTLDSSFDSGLTRNLITEQSRWTRIILIANMLIQTRVVTMNRRSEPHRILAQLSSIQQTPSLVIAFCCDPHLASMLFLEANRLNMLNGEWVFNSSHCYDHL